MAGYVSRMRAALLRSDTLATMVMLDRPDLQADARFLNDLGSQAMRNDGNEAHAMTEHLRAAHRMVGG